MSADEVESASLSELEDTPGECEPVQFYNRRRNRSPELEAIYKRLDEGDGRMNRIEEIQHATLESLKQNTIATNQIAENTAGFVDFSNDIAAGTRFMCRCALGIRFLLKEVVEPFWKPTVICYAAYYWTSHQRLPEWMADIFKLVGG